jgi:hypothetical protein
VSRIVSVLCLVVCGCATAVEKPPPGTPKIKAKWVAVVTDRLTTIRGSFSLPPGCRAECRFHYDEWSAVMSCPELQGSLRYWSGLYAPPLAAREATMVEVDRLQGVTSYWGWTRTPRPAFCAVVRQTVVDVPAGVPSYSWCSDSNDVDMQNTVLSMLRRFSIPPVDAVPTCGLFAEPTTEKH